MVNNEQYKPQAYIPTPVNPPEHIFIAYSSTFVAL